MTYQWVKTTYLVTADHSSPRYRANKLPCVVSGDNGYGIWGYYAYADGYGMGHTKASEEAAILDLFAANGCTNIRFEIA